MSPLGRPRLHLRTTGSTNDRARELAAAGAPHGTLVTAREQTAGRGRQGRTWIGPPGRALLLSLVLRELESLLPLRAGLAVADVAADDALVKWPNDVWIAGRKVAGVLVESRPQDGWAVLGIGLNVAVELAELPEELHATAGTLGRGPRSSSRRCTTSSTPWSAGWTSRRRPPSLRCAPATPCTAAASRGRAARAWLPASTTAAHCS